MTPELSFDEYWPYWPEGVQGNPLVDMWYQCEFSHFVDTLWSPDSAFLIEANKERHFADFQCTDWLTSEEELPDLPGGFDWTYERNKTGPVVGNISGKIRKVRFENRKGSVVLLHAFKSEEVQRCIIHEDDKRCIVIACVNSSAPLCENIRVLCKYTCEAHGERKTHLSIVYHVVYLRSVNSIYRLALDRGSRDGLSSNYSTFTRVLSNFVPIASKEGSVIESESSEEAEVPEAVTQPSKRVGYEPLINWPALPPVGLLKSLYGISTESNGFIMTFWRLLSVILHFYLLSFLFGFFTFAFETFLALTKESYIVPNLTFQEALVGALLLMVTLEICHLTLYIFFQFLNWPWNGVVTLSSWIGRSCRQITFRRQLTRRTSEVTDYEDALDDGNDSNVPDLVPSISHVELPSSTSVRTSFSNVSRTVSSILFPGSYEASKYHNEASLRSRVNPDGSIVEEVFENERLQPFRGWGHSWPGHFLPTDKCAHWCAFDEKGSFLTSNDRKLIEPQLPPGWEWIEDDWKVDKELDGQDSIDSNGWCYGLDFPWIKYSRERNAGLRKISDFVRRRRHVRTRRKTVFEEEIGRNQGDRKRTQKLENIDFKTGRIEPPYFSFFNFV